MAVTVVFWRADILHIEEMVVIGLCRWLRTRGEGYLPPSSRHAPLHWRIRVIQSTRVLSLLAPSLLPYLRWAKQRGTSRPSLHAPHHRCCTPSLSLLWRKLGLAISAAPRAKSPEYQRRARFTRRPLSAVINAHHRTTTHHARRALQCYHATCRAGSLFGCSVA